MKYTISNADHELLRDGGPRGWLATSFLVSLLAASTNAAVLNEWQFDHDANAATLPSAQNIGTAADVWGNTKVGYEVNKGRFTGTNDANPVAGNTRFNTGFFVSANMGSTLNSDSHLRVDFDYDFSDPTNDVGSIVAFALRDENNKDWGVRVNYNQANGAITLQSGVNGVWQDLSPVIGLTGSINVIVFYDHTNGRLSYYIDTTGAGNFPATPTNEIVSSSLSATVFAKYRMQLSGDLIATSVPAVAVENVRHATTFAEAAIAIPYLHRLSPAERELMETDLGISISNKTSEDIALHVKAVSPVQWRTDADARIENHRKADLDIALVDTYGRPVDGATINTKLANHQFIFGGILNAKDRVGDSVGVDSTNYEANALKMFNSFGLNNALKPKLQNGLKPYLADFFQWAEGNDIPVRGHALIWPGSTHMSANVRALLDICLAAEPEELEAAKTALDAAIDAEITDWASQWDVYEWDVLNEPVTNHEVQDMLGGQVMAEWFANAQNNSVNANARLMVNEYQIISAPSTVGGWTANTYTSRSTSFKSTLDRLISDSAPLHAIGFQSRFGWERTDPELLYTRLEEFASYNLPMAATEFEVKPKAYNASLDYEFAPTEDLRAQITAEVMRTYFSHDQVYAFNAWTFYDDEIGLIADDGTFKLNGLVWYYLTRIQWHTNADLVTDPSGLSTLRGFLGDYTFTINHAGHEYTIDDVLSEDDTITFIIAVDSDGDGILDDEDVDDDGDGHDDVDDLYPTDPARWNDVPVWNSSSFSTADASEDTPYSKWINWRVTNDAGETVIFAIENGPSWLSITANGQITGTPTQADVGTHVFTLSASDGVHSAVTAQLTIEVLEVNDVPVFNQENIQATDADQDTAYAGASLAGLAADSDPGAILGYSKLSGPAWLTVSVDGSLSGTPGLSDVGNNIFTVQVSDGLGGLDTAALNVEVIAAPVWSILVSDDFENGFSTFTGDGTSGKIYGGSTYAHQGSKAALIKKDNVTSLIDLVNVIDATQYQKIKMEFWYYVRNFDDANDDFLLQYWDGSAWVTAQTWAYTVDFQNNEFKQASVTLDTGSLNLTNDFKVRFRCDANNNNDKVYIDEVTISGLQ